MPDTLPEVDFAPPRGRSRRQILLWGVAGWALATGVAWALLSRDGTQLRSPRSLSPAGETTAAPAATIPDEPAAPPARSTPSLPAATHSSANAEPIPLLPDCQTALNDSHGELEHSDWNLPRDMTQTDYGALLDGPTARQSLKHCTHGKSMRVDLCVAVRGIRAVGASVTTEPDSGDVRACINRTIAEFRFPHQPRIQLFRSHLNL